MSVSTTAIEMARKNQLHRFKLVLLGESGVGKTALVVRFVKNSFSDKFDSTIGGLLFLPTFWVDEKEQQLKPQQVKLEIWDTAGQERYRSITPMYIRGARAAIVVYDITNWNSFLQAKTWVEFLRNTQLSYLDNQRVVIAFVGNKMDLADERREVDRREAESYAAGNDLIFMESSAKSSLNVQELFHKIGQSLLKKERLRMAEEDEAKSGAGAGTGGARRSRNSSNNNGTEGGRGGGGGLGGIVLSRVEAEWQGARQQMQQNGCCS